MQGGVDLIRSRLESVGYYRLSGYWFPFRDGGDRFRDGASIEKVWELYVFDRQLRLLMMDAIERIEVAVRARLSLLHAVDHGPFAYAEDASTLPGLDTDDLNQFRRSATRLYKRSKEAFAEHFRSVYQEHEALPVWMACETFDFGSVLTLYRGSSNTIQTRIADDFSVHRTVFLSWIRSLNTVRNICAHHGRLWNRQLGVKPSIPKNDPSWRVPVVIGNSRVFGTLSICRNLMTVVAPQSSWFARTSEAVRVTTPYIRYGMGFPGGWQDSPIWAKPR